MKDQNINKENKENINFKKKMNDSCFFCEPPILNLFFVL